MLSSLPKFMDRNFIIGFFVPALVAILAILLCFFPQASKGPLAAVFALGLSDDTLGKLFYLTLAVWLLSLALVMTNHIQYRILEGYLPPVSWLRPLRERQRRRYDRLKDKIGPLLEERDQLEKQLSLANDDTERERLRAAIAENRGKRSPLRRREVTEFPPRRTEVMTTRFGNVIRAFEVYPREMYGVDAIAVWPRLSAVIPKDFMRLIEEARAQCDCFVNLCFVGGVISSIALIRITLRAIPGLATGMTQEPAPYADAWILGCAAVVAVLAYRWSIERIAVWGEQVKSAFDCFLPALVTRLGYEMPKTDDDWRTFWTEFNRFALYERAMSKDRWTRTNAQAEKS